MLVLPLWNEIGSTAGFEMFSAHRQQTNKQCQRSMLQLQLWSVASVTSLENVLGIDLRGLEDSRIWDKISPVKSGFTCPE